MCKSLATVITVSLYDKPEYSRIDKVNIILDEEEVQPVTIPVLYPYGFVLMLDQLCFSRSRKALFLIFGMFLYLFGR